MKEVWRMRVEGLLFYNGKRVKKNYSGEVFLGRRGCDVGFAFLQQTQIRERR